MSASTTRSSSPMPVLRGDPCAVSTSPMSCAVPAGTNDMPAASDAMLLALGSSTSSTRLFHAPHAVHLPVHLGYEAPQSEQL